MERNIIFLSSAALIVVIICVLFLASVVTMQNGRISDLMITLDSYSARITALEDRITVNCMESHFSSPNGKNYLKVSGKADEDGDVWLRVENMDDDTLLVMNIREVVVENEGDEFTADYSSSPTFRDSEMKSFCGGALTEGEFMDCVSTEYKERVRKAREDGEEALFIRHIKADISTIGDKLMAEDVCIRL